MQLSDARIHYGRILRAIGRYAEAESALLPAHAWRNEHTPADHGTGVCLRELQRLYEAWQRPEDAARWGEALEEWRTAHPATSR